MLFLPGAGKRIEAGFIPVLLFGKSFSFFHCAGLDSGHGLFFSIATDLNLHLVTNTKASNELQERENLNKVRVWMNCFNLDRSTATQFGKPSTIKED